MPTPAGIRRRERDPGAPTKTVTQLRLFRGLYLEARAHPRQTVGPVEPWGLPFREIQCYTEASIRTLTRYLRELEDCGAIRRAWFCKAAGEDGTHIYCRAEVGKYLTELAVETLSPHLRRLYRQTRLMWRFMRAYPGSLEGILETRQYSKLFFEDALEQEQWYDEVDSGISPRTWKRDLQSVWQALQIDREDVW